jgi:hypothetical protein
MGKVQGGAIMKLLSVFIISIIIIPACTVSKIYPEKYYSEHKDMLHQTQTLYKKAVDKKAFALGFTSLDFSSISIELKTDTVRYIYDFSVDDMRMNDTLQKLGYDTSGIQQIITNMKALKMTWINTLDYYVDDNRKTLSFLSIPVKQFSILPLFQKIKYYFYKFYGQPPDYYSSGQLLDNKNSRRIRKVDGQHFLRINDRVSYTISGKFR